MSVFVLAAGNEAWKDKQVAEWSVDDAKQLLTDSPWVKSVTPTSSRPPNDGQRQSGGRRGGFGVGGIGLPGIGGGYPGSRQPRRTDDDSHSRQIPTLTVRWESALPVREAELKARETGAPEVDEDSYAVAVYGLPNKMDTGTDQLKKQASIKREGKKDLKPSSVQVLQREDGTLVVYLFPRSKEITKEDRRLEFDAQVGQLQFTQSFYVEDMTYQGKLQL